MNLRKKRFELQRRSKETQELCFDDKNKNSNKTKEVQNQIYKKFKFYDNFIKAKEKIK